MSFSKEPVAFLGLGFFITCNLHRTIRRGDLVGIFTFEKYSITFFHPNFNSSTKCWGGGVLSSHFGFRWNTFRSSQFAPNKILFSGPSDRADLEPPRSQSTVFVEDEYESQRSQRSHRIYVMVYLFDT